MAASSFRAAQQQQQQHQHQHQYSGSSSGGFSSYTRDGAGPGGNGSGNGGILLNGNNSSQQVSPRDQLLGNSNNNRGNGGYSNNNAGYFGPNPGGNASANASANGMDGSTTRSANNSSNGGLNGRDQGQSYASSSGMAQSSSISPSNSAASNGNNASTGQSSRNKPVTNSAEEIEDSRRIAKVHFEEFKAFLDAEGMRDANARVNAREKLTRLTRQQFQELSTDVYDELVRRSRTRNGPTTEFLPVIAEFHPKRNQARQKLATLPKVRFRDLASDVYFELERRYPEFKESEVPEQSQQPPLQASNSQRNRPQFPNGNPNGQLSSSSNSSNNPQGQGNVANEVIIPNKSTLVEEDVGMPPSSSTNSMAGPSSTSAISGLGRSRGYSVSTSTNGPVPRKSTDRERDVVSPSNYGRGEPSSPVSQDGGGGRKSNDLPRLTGPQPSSPDWGGSLARASEASSIGTRLIGGYGSSSATGEREWDREAHQDELEKLRRDYEFRIATMQNRMQGLERDLDDLQGNSGRDLEREKERNKGLERELDKLQQRNEDAQASIEQLERELAEAQDQPPAPQIPLPPVYPDNSAEISRLQEALREAENQLDNESSVVQNLQKEIDGLVDTLREMNGRQDGLVTEREEDQGRLEEMEKECQEWKKRYEGAKTELRNLKATSQLFVKPNKPDDDYMPTSPDGAIIDTHVTSFQSSIDDLLIGGRSNAPSSVIIATKQVINAVARIDEDVQAYEASGRTEHLLSPDEKERLLQLKSKCNATLSNLTTAARNHATGHGLSPVSLLDAAASHLSMTIIELVRLLSLRKAGSPLPPMANGFSDPTRSASSTPQQQQQQYQLQSSSSQSRPNGNGFPTRLNSLRQEDGGPTSYNNSSSAPNGRVSPAQSIRSRTGTADRSYSESPDPTQSSSSYDQQQSRIPPSSSNTSLASTFTPPKRTNSRQQEQTSQRAVSPKPPPLQEERPDYGDDDGRSYDGAEQEERRAYDQTQGEEGEEQDQADWAELKNYLEAQTEAIVHSITALLAAIRGGAQAPKLEENLSQIITIVSSIVAILKDNLPQPLRPEAEPIISDLSENCEKLIELQNQAGDGQNFTKQIKQQMATASFGVAKSLKSMNGLLSNA